MECVSNFPFILPVPAYSVSWDARAISGPVLNDETKFRESIEGSGRWGPFRQGVRFSASAFLGCWMLRATVVQCWVIIFLSMWSCATVCQTTRQFRPGKQAIDEFPLPFVKIKSPRGSNAARHQASQNNEPQDNLMDFTTHSTIPMQDARTWRRTCAANCTGEFGAAPAPRCTLRAASPNTVNAEKV